MLALRTVGLVLVAVGALGAVAALIGLLGGGTLVPGALLLGLTLPLMPAASAGMTGPTDKAQRTRISLGLLTWFAGAGLVVFGPSLGLDSGLSTAGLAIVLLSGAALGLAGWTCIRPAPTRQQRRARDAE